MKERELAKWEGSDLEIEDHGWLVLTGHFKYENGTCQGWVTHDGGNIELVEPLHKDCGTPFNISEWRQWMERRGPKISAYEYRTGEKP